MVVREGLVSRAIVPHALATLRAQGGEGSSVSGCPAAPKPSLSIYSSSQKVAAPVEGLKIETYPVYHHLNIRFSFSFALHVAVSFLLCK